jgi:hypothetical protein
VNRHVIERALSSSIRDFKDAVLSEAGELAGAECIITRNARLQEIPVADLGSCRISGDLSQVKKWGRTTPIDKH